MKCFAKSWSRVQFCNYFSSLSHVQARPAAFTVDYGVTSSGKPSCPCTESETLCVPHPSGVMGLVGSSVCVSICLPPPGAAQGIWPIASEARPLSLNQHLGHLNPCGLSFLSLSLSPPFLSPCPSLCSSLPIFLSRT